MLTDAAILSRTWLENFVICFLDESDLRHTFSRMHLVICLQNVLSTHMCA